MANGKTQIPISLKFTGDIGELRQQMAQIEQQLRSLSTANSTTGNKSLVSSLKKDFEDLQKIIGGNGLIDNGAVNKSVDNINKSFKNLSATSKTETQRIADGFSALKNPIQEGETHLQKFGRTLTNSLRYNVVNDFMDSFLSQGGQVISFLEDVDKNLNNIRIVSGKTQAEMAGFLTTATASARELGSITNDYLEASEIYYQQGLSTSEVNTRTEATVKSASIAGQSVATTADQATAILNGFNIKASQTVEVLGKIAQVGAGTATDFAEIAKATQKVANSASEANISFDKTLGMIATISSVTREAPEAIGTSLNSIIARFNNLSVAEEGYTSKIQEAFENTKTGLSIFDEQTGLLKGISEILDEVAGKWQFLDVNQQKTITSAIAGTRQANRLMALLGNYDMFKEYTEMSENSEGALEEQNQIYLQSLQAIQNQAQASKEALYNELFNPEMLKEFYTILSQIMDTITSVVSKTGGLTGIILPLVSVMRQPLMNMIAPSVTRFAQNRLVQTKGNPYDKQAAETSSEYNKFKGQDQRELQLLTTKETSLALTDIELKKYNGVLDLLEKQTQLRAEIITQQEHLNKLQAVDNDEVREAEELLAVNQKIIKLEEEYNKTAAQRQKVQREKEKEKLPTTKSGTIDKRTKQYKEYQNDNIDDYKLNLKSGTDFNDIISENGLTDAANDVAKTISILKEKKKSASIEAQQDINNEIALLTSLKRNIGQVVNEVDELANKQDLAFNPQTSIMELNATQQLVSSLGKLEGAKREQILKTVAEKTKSANTWDILSEKTSKASEEEKRRVVAALNEEIEAERRRTEAAVQSNQKTVTKNLDAENAGSGWVSSKKKSTKLAAALGIASQVAMGAAGAFQIYNTVTNESLTGTQKLEGVVQGAGAALSAIPGITGLVGMAITMLGPVLIETFGLGQSEAEKLTHKIDATRKSFETFTKSIKQQSADLSSIEKLYTKLAKKYQETTFLYGQLSEEEQSQYDQVAEYIENYAPELIKYYDSEGKAVLDLSKQYTDAESKKKSYLRTSLEYNELMTYGQLKGQASESAELLSRNYTMAQSEVIKTQEKISSVRSESLKTGKDVTEQLTTLEEQLSKTKTSISSMAADWDSMVSKVLTKGTIGFSELDKTIQDSLYNLTSYESYTNSEIGLTEDMFIAKTEFIIRSITSMSVKAKENFTNLTSGVREQVLNLALDMELTGVELNNFLSTITDKTFLSGEFLDDFALKQQVRIEATKIELASATENLEKYKEIRDEMAKTPEYKSRLVTGNTSKSTYAPPTETAPSPKEDKSKTDYGKVSSDIRDAEDSIDDLSEKLKYAQNETNLLYAEWQDGVRDFANSSAEAYNQVVESYNSMRDELEKGIDMKGNILDEDAMSDLERRVGMTYAVLQGDNQEYYQQWRELNSRTVGAIAEDYGIDANNYRTYNEYKAALDEAQAKLKVLYELAAAGNVEEVNKKLFEYKKQNMIQELAAQGKTKEAAVIMSAEESKAETYMSNITKINRLENLKAELKAKEVSANGSIEVTAKEAGEITGINAELQTKLKGSLISFAGGFADKVLSSLGVVTGRSTFEINKVQSVAMVQGIIDELNAENSKIEKEIGDKLGSAQKAISGIGDLENYIAGLQYSTEDFKDIALKPIVKPSVPNNTEGIGTGGKDKKEKAEKKDVEDISFDLDPLKKYTDLIEKLTHEMELLKKEREKLYGQKYIDNLNKEASLNREILKVEEDKLKKIKEITKERQDQLAKSGVQFDESGLIKNYNEVLLAQQLATNALTGDAKEASKAMAENLKDLMDKYEEYALKKKRDAEKAVQDLKAELADLAMEKIQYPIQLIIDASEKDKSYLELIMNIERYKKGKINFSITADESAQNLVNSLGTIQEIFNQTSGGQGFINSIMNDPDLANDPKKQLEMIQEQQDKMQELAGELVEFANQFEEAFGNALEEALSLLEAELSKFDNIISQYEYILDLSDKLNLTSIDQLNTTYGSIASIYQNNMNQYKSMAESIKKSRDSFAVGTEEWITANDKYMDAQSKIMEQEKQLADLLGKRFDATVSTGRSDLEKALFGGYTLEEVQDQFDKMTAERNKYLDTERKIYELSKLERNINKDINSYQYDSKAQAALKKFMKDELSYLNSKEKLTQSDLDLTQKQYNVIKARVDLERAYDNEQYQMMLQRNADGSFGYMYVQNTDGIADVEQAYQDAIDELYKYSIQRTEELQKESITIRSDALSEYDKIAKKLKAGTIDEKEAVELLNKAFDDMKKKLEENAKAQAEMQKQTASSKLLQILGVSESELGGLNDLEKSIEKTFDILESNGETSGLESVIASLGLSSKKYIGSAGQQISELFQDLGGDSGAMQKIMEAFSQTGNSTAATIMALLNQTGDLSSLTEQILQESLNGAGDKFDDFLDQISSGTIKPEDLFTESLENGLDGVKDTWGKLNDIITLDLETFVKQFDAGDPESVLGKVTSGILGAYEDYHEALENSYDNIIKREEELANSTEEYNKHLQTTVDKIKDEIVAVTEVTQKYAALRQEILDTISQVANYIDILNQARQAIEAGNKPSSTPGGGGGGGSVANSGGGSSSGGGSGSNSGGGTGGKATVGSRVRIVGNQVFTTAYSTGADTVYPSYFNSGRTDLFVDGEVNGKYRVKEKGKGYVGWFNPASLQAFHDGGLIDVNKEGMALVKKNEAVFTEQELSLVSKMKEMLSASGMEDIDKYGTTISNSNQQTTQQIEIQANFPNATNSREIEEALKSLYINSSQYINKR